MLLTPDNDILSNILFPLCFSSPQHFIKTVSGSNISGNTVHFPQTFYPAAVSYKIKNKDSRNITPDRPHTYFIFPVIYCFPLDQKVDIFPVYAAFTS